MTQRLRRFEVRILQDAAHSHVRFFAPAAGGKKPADDVVQRVGLRQGGDIDIEPDGEFLCEPVVQEARAAVGCDLQELRSHDWNHAALLDEAQEVIPGVIIESRHRRRHDRQSSHAQYPMRGCRLVEQRTED